MDKKNVDEHRDSVILDIFEDSYIKQNAWKRITVRGFGLLALLSLLLIVFMYNVSEVMVIGYWFGYPQQQQTKFGNPTYLRDNSSNRNEEGHAPDGEDADVGGDAGGEGDADASDDESLTSWKFRHRKKEDWTKDSFRLKASESRDAAFTVVNGRLCFNRGSNVEESMSKGSCVCYIAFYGDNCAIPDSVWHGSLSNSAKKKLSLREKPRRIVQTLIVNHEFDFFEARIKDHWDVVDVFLILESKYTAFGKEKETMFFEKLKAGWLKKYQKKILYIYLDFFHEKGKSDGWFADSHPRVYMGEQGLTRILGLEDDDIIVYCDADEIPHRSTLEFLKYFEGFPEPINFVYRWTVFGFFWLSQDKSGNEQTTQVIAAATWKLVNKGFKNNVWAVRGKKYLSMSPYRENIAASGIQVSTWSIGSINHYAGSHCSWCFSTPDIQTKLLSAQSDDGPRWGNYPEKVKSEFIEKIRKSGKWFDEKNTFKKVEYAPPYILENFSKFKNILVPP